MNYEQMSDFEINKAVASALGHKDLMADLWPGCENRVVICGENPVAVDYCNGPEDAWPIIKENGISLSAWQNGKDWTAWFAGNSMEHCAPEFSHASDNPLRSAMIVYLMMQESA